MEVQGGLSEDGDEGAGAEAEGVVRIARCYPTLQSWNHTASHWEILAEHLIDLGIHGLEISIGNSCMIHISVD
jgi:hypothetical protein